MVYIVYSVYTVYTVYIVYNVNIVHNACNEYNVYIVFNVDSVYNVNGVVQCMRWIHYIVYNVHTVCIADIACSQSQPRTEFMPRNLDRPTPNFVLRLFVFYKAWKCITTHDRPTKTIHIHLEIIME